MPKLDKFRTMATLTLDKGETVQVEKIGKGRFTTAWRNCTNVYLQTHETDYSKEILSSLAHADRNPHIPDVSELGWMDNEKPYRWYKAPLYHPLTAANKIAWKQYKTLHNLTQTCWSKALYILPTNPNATAQRYNELLRESLESADLFDTLKEAVEQLIDSCYSYGTGYMIEVTKKNCAVDDAGTLILLDPVFDREQVIKR
jgi:hypothetical protein